VDDDTLIVATRFRLIEDLRGEHSRFRSCSRDLGAPADSC
jgi:hypothetical protein